MRKITIPLLTGFGLLCCLPAPGLAADTLFTNATFHVDVAHTVTNLLVSGDTVAAQNVNPANYPSATGVNLNRADVYPGFHDSHCHVMEVGADGEWALIAGTNDAAGIVAAVATKASQTLPGDQIMAAGWSMITLSNTWTLANLAALDAASGNHPAFLMDSLGHNAIVNTLAMTKYSITATSSVAPSGVIVIENGKATGLLREAAMQLAGQPMMDKTPDKIAAGGTIEVLRYFASLGYTSINDMMGTPAGRFMRPQIFRQMETNGTLPLRVNYCYMAYALDQIDNATNYVGQDTEMVRFAGIKMFVDGAFGAGEAWTSWTNLQGNFGQSYVTTNDAWGTNYNLNRMVDRLDELKLNVQYHVQGDAGIEAILHALDAVIAKRGKLSSLHALAHIGFPRPDQILRMQGFGTNLLAVVQPAFWSLENEAGQYYGDQMTNSYPIKSLLNGGLTVAVSTDFAVSPVPDPRMFMAIGLTPTNYVPPTRTALTMADMINGLTVGSAATVARKDLGTLAVGNKADLVVFSLDLYAMTPGMLKAKSTKVLSTWVGGKISYDSKTATDIAITTQPGSITLSWPLAFTDWTLQIQTNVVGIGLSTNWVAVPEAAGTNRFVIPTGQFNGAAFYRLAY